MSPFRIAGLILLSAFLLQADVFTLKFFDDGPITLHTTLTFDGKGERLIATAKNESGAPIRRVKICVASASVKKGCLFEVWNTAVWAPGAELSWNVTTALKTTDLSHDAMIEDYEGVAPAIATPQQVPKTTGTSIRANKAQTDQWETGRVIDTNRASYLATIWESSSTSGTLNSSSNGSLHASTLNTGIVSQTSGTINEQTHGTVESHTSTTKTPIYRVYEDYAIETDRYMYLTRERLIFVWSKPAHLIVNGTVQFRAEGQKLVILDNDGKKHDAEILKQYLKPDKTDSAPTVPGPTPPQVQAQPFTNRMTNDDVLALKAAGFGDEFIITKIKASSPGYVLDTAALVRLKQAGLSELVIGAMVQTAAPK